MKHYGAHSRVSPRYLWNFIGSVIVCLWRWDYREVRFEKCRLNTRVGSYHQSNTPRRHLPRGVNYSYGFIIVNYSYGFIIVNYSYGFIIVNYSYGFIIVNYSYGFTPHGPLPRRTWRRASIRPFSAGLWADVGPQPAGAQAPPEPRTTRYVGHPVAHPTS